MFNVKIFFAAPLVFLRSKCGSQNTTESDEHKILPIHKIRPQKERVENLKMLKKLFKKNFIETRY